MVQYFLSHPYYEIRELRTTVLPSLRHHLHFLPNDRCLRSGPPPRNTLLRQVTKTAANLSTAVPFPSYLSHTADPLPSNALTLELGEVHIWWLQHSSSSSSSSSSSFSSTTSHVLQLHQACTALITPEEVSECAASKDKATQELRLLARAFSRSVLCRYLPVESAESTVEKTTTTTSTASKTSSIDPSSLLFQRNEHGKPELSHPIGTSLRFNLTHTPGLIGIAVTRDVSVGLDAEAMDRKTRGSALQLAKRRFSQLEIQQLENHSQDASSQAALFIKLWTLKEAFVKAVGRGISAAPGLKGFSFSFSEPPREGTLTLSFHQNSNSIKTNSNNNNNGGDGNDGWEFALMQPTEGHLAAVCCRKQKSAVSTGPLKITSFLASTAHDGGAQVHAAKILARGSTLEGDEE